MIAANELRFIALVKKCSWITDGDRVGDIQNKGSDPPLPRFPETSRLDRCNRLPIKRDSGERKPALGAGITGLTESSDHEAAVDADDLPGHGGRGVRRKHRSHRPQFIGFDDALLDVLTLR